MSDSLQENDAVTVSSSDNKELEGVVAYVGPVEFNDDNDWVGIRLTGKSIGYGKNDGSVQGKRYFDCPDGCGIFVKTSAVKKRTLSRLEELRLRRELATTTVGGSGAAAATTSSSSITGTRTPPRTSVTSTDTSKSTTASGTKSKLEELRQRRAALKLKQQESSGSDIKISATTAAAAAAARTSLSPSSSSAPTAASLKEIEELKEQIGELNQKLDEKNQEADELRKKLESAEELSTRDKAKIVELQETIANKPKETPTKVRLTQNIEDAQETILQLQSINDEIKDNLNDTLREVSNLKIELNREKESHVKDTNELSRAKAETIALQNQLNELVQSKDQRGASDAAHYKERAKLQAETIALKRKIEQLEKDKIELESSIEDITLDKEQLQEERDALEEKYEEIKLDAETAQMENEELRIELEDTKATAERLTGVHQSLTTAAAIAGSTSTPSKQQEHNENINVATTEEMSQALQVQNARLREALIRLREQTALEKMELTRKLKTVEKDVQINTDIQKEINELRTNKLNLEEQINDLKDMIEQGAAFEGMVEDLSDRVMLMEETAISLRNEIREYEEDAELSAEIQEVQQTEIKELTYELETRDSCIRNLEEAIKMQRRREEDFRRTVGNYKITVETLKQEKQALLELQEGGEGEKSTIIASSQQALSRAAQLVTDAANMRKRDAQSVIDRIDTITYKHLSDRIENLLPHDKDFIYTEINAIKGELFGSKVICKASQSLHGITTSLRKNIRPSLLESGKAGDDVSPTTTTTTGMIKIDISDDIRQQLATIIHQTEFAKIIASVSSDLLRFLVAGQWPELLSLNESAELGSIIGHTIPGLDNALGIVLKSLKEEGSLTVEQSNIGELQLAIQNTMQALRSEIERDDKMLVSSTWNPPGWKLLSDASVSKFCCLGSAAALSLTLESIQEGNESYSALNALYSKVEQTYTLATNSCLRLVHLDLQNDKLIGDLNGLFSTLTEQSNSLLQSVQNALLTSSEIKKCMENVDTTIRTLTKVSSALRAENMNPSEGDRYHPLSPETDDAWLGVAVLTQKVRAIDADGDDINYLVRAREIEHHLSDAVENEPKLVIANNKVSSLEKSLSSRSKEIAMQNARLSELERIVARSSSSVSRSKNVDIQSTEEFNSLKEENRVLTEAMDVLQREVEMYENEIRALKDPKTPRRGGPSNRTPRRAATSITDVTLSPRAPSEELQYPSALQATLFRPALQEAIEQAARWKTSATAEAIKNLPPLPVLPSISGQSDSDFRRLSTSLSSNRLLKASATLVNLTRTDKTPRAQLRELKLNNAKETERLESILLRLCG